MARFARRSLARGGSARFLKRGFAFLGCVLVVLSFSTAKPHNFANHFRVPEVSRLSVHDSFVAQGEERKVERVVQSGQDLAPSFAVETESDTSLIVDLETPDSIQSNKRVRFHRKLGSPPSNSEEAHI
jgi:hypothetical protein